MSRRTRWEKSASRKRSSNEEAEDKQIHYPVRNAVSAGTAGCVPAVDELRAGGAGARESARWGNRCCNSGPIGAAGRRPTDNDVCSPGMGPAVAIGTDEFHCAVAPGLSLAVSREKQPDAGSAGRHFARVDAVHRMARDEHDGISV